jgi:hypothetical protein
MADLQKNAVIYFGERDRIELRSTVKQIHNQLEGVTNPTIPIIELQAPDGEPVYVNANHVRAFAEYNTAGKGMAAF